MTRGNVILALVFLGMLAFVVFVDSGGRGGGRAPTISLELFPGFDALDAESIDIHGRGERSLEIRRSGDAWVIASSGDYPAETDKVDAFLNKMATLKRGEVVSRNPESYAHLGVDGSNIDVTVRGADDAVLAHLYIGARGSRGQSAFVRREGMEEVLKVLDRDLYRICNPYGGAWIKDHDVLSFDHRLVERIEMKKRGDLVVLERNDDGDWVEREPFEIGVDQKLANGLARTLGKLRFTDVAGAAEEGAYGFDAPSLEITVVLPEGEIHSLVFGAKTGDGQYRFVRREGSPYAYLVNAKLDKVLFATGYGFVENKTGRESGAEGRVFEGPPVGPDLIRNTIRADLVVLARAEASAIREDGTLAKAPGEQQRWLPVPFEVEEVLYGDDLLDKRPGGEGANGGARRVVIALPARRKLPDLRPEGNPYLIFAVRGDEGLRLQGDPIENLFQPDLERLKYVRQVLAQRKSRDEATRGKPGPAGAGGDAGGGGGGGR